MLVAVPDSGRDPQRATHSPRDPCRQWLENDIVCGERLHLSGTLLDAGQLCALLCAAAHAPLQELRFAAPGVRWAQAQATHRNAETISIPGSDAAALSSLWVAETGAGSGLNVEMDGDLPGEIAGRWKNVDGAGSLYQGVPHDE